jgi:hypothetical protein
VVAHRVLGDLQHDWHSSGFGGDGEGLGMLMLKTLNAPRPTAEVAAGAKTSVRRAKLIDAS